MKKRLLISIVMFVAVLCGATRINAQDCDHCGFTCNIWAASGIDDIREELKGLNIPVLEFELKDGQEPTYEVAAAPPGCIGKTIINNEYVEGRLRITLKGETIYDSGEYQAKESGVRLKYRGNTSTAQDYINKKSYKIKLSKKADLINNGQSSKDKDWILLGIGSRRLNNIVGNTLGRICGLSWQPTAEHVCVIVNNEYKGSYILTEGVTAGKKRVDIEDTGYIVENDAYWWKPDEVYFKSNHLVDFMGWTFKEPDTDDFSEMTMANMEWVIKTAESRLFNGDDVSDLLDYESFASWLLVHEILNTADACGSNVFVQKGNFDIMSPFETKLKMGPVWDFDDSMAPDEGKHAPIRTYPSFWYHKLIEIPEFNSIFEEKWKGVRGDLYDRIEEAIDNYIETNPEIHHVRLIDARRNIYYTSCPYEDKVTVMDFMKKRIASLDKLILGIEPEVGVDEIEDDETGEKGQDTQVCYDLQGRKLGSDSKGVRVSINAAGKPRKEIK